MIEKGRKYALPAHTRAGVAKYLTAGGLKFLYGTAVEVVRRDRSIVAGRFVTSDPAGVILETAPDEITAIPIREVRTLRRPRPPRAGGWPSAWCVGDCSACGRITLCRRTQGRGVA